MSKRVREPVLAVGDVNFACERFLYHPETNPNGFIHFGTAMNRAIMEEIVQYLPEYLTTKDTVYQMPPGSIPFRELIVNSSGLTGRVEADDVATMNSIYAIISALSLQLHNNSLTGGVIVSGVTNSEERLGFVASHSYTTGRWKSLSISEVVSSSVDHRLHLVVLQNGLAESQGEGEGVSLDEAIEYFRGLQQRESTTATVFVLESAAQLCLFLDSDNATLPNGVVFAMSHQVRTGITCGFAWTKDFNLLRILKSDAFFAPFSSAAQSAALAGKDFIVEGDSQQHYSALAKELVDMIAITENITGLNPDNIVFGTGGSAILDGLGRILFSPGDAIALDSSFYSGFVNDFTGRSSIRLHYIDFFDDEEDDLITFNPLKKKVVDAKYRVNPTSGLRRIKNTLLLRCKRAYEDGCRGMIVCNPHNPSGRVYASEEVSELCEWVISLNNTDKGDFHVIFDELYSHSIYDSVNRQFVSAIPYTQQSSHIHVVRGFAKDFGLCGFKTGYGFTSHAMVLDRLRSWRRICEPHPINACILRDMLIKTDHGQIIYNKNQIILRQAVEFICNLLDKAHISYIRPKAGVFLMINLSQEIRSNASNGENEYTVWKKLLESKKVNITPGALFGYKEQGWYRLCPFTSLAVIEEGINRIGAFVNEELR